ncbi:tetratricopeptide repeat protein [Paucibacter sp. Y2R2-4]|uniref:tetratricopeptide repeat protein n=1 Tax=Paucibacter sp. Y2R2-4 TaxID=2893553 RepID=UPI0021E3D58D|nr:tetratricopeptide repeat protein [Paucibacter sp. Y2R2-4]MCV2350411.1 tetratricopeptide repeat protein [Paucibacter sp. Y2R2-4]
MHKFRKAGPACSLWLSLMLAFGSTAAPSALAAPVKKTAPAAKSTAKPAPKSASKTSKPAPKKGAAKAAAPQQADAALKIERLLIQQDYRAAAPLIEALQSKPLLSNAERSQLYQWHFIREDMATVDAQTREVLEPAAKGFMAADFQAAGRLALEQRNFERAKACFERALQLSPSPQDRATALQGQGQIALQQRDYEGSLKLLESSVKTYPRADGLMAMADTLIRLGRTDEAISASERAVALNPLHEMAHYHLGNGYARKNYSELAKLNPKAFVAAQDLTRQASEAFVRGDFKAAEALSFQALRQQPGYGRAHAVLAKAIESQRMAMDMHRAAAEARFAATPMPEVPGIERYVLNWAELSPRHQKRVALSVAPWKAYIPVLLEGGLTHFIKPLHMKLSETPGAQALKDARINYDSRLWDDVRGAGGFNTVTGIEDVERSIFNQYNTVLHELTHQVHGIMTADQAREIQELYRQAKTRDEASRDGFLSRYAGGSVWEYFAEGANSYDSPRRDAYDNREIVRERLQAMDPALMALVKRHLEQADVRASLPIALVNAGNQKLEEGDATAAQALFARAAQAAPDDEQVLASLLSGHAILGQKAEARAVAAKALSRYPRSGHLLVGALDAGWHGGQPLAELSQSLSASRERLAGEDRYRVDLSLGEAYRKLGDAPRALAAFDAALGYQSDSPEALWGRAAALGLAERWDEAFAVYEKALRLRTGVLELRADLIQDLLRAGRLPQARSQLKEARLLDPQEPRLLALQAWLTLAERDAAGAARLADAALKQGPWCDLALIVKAAALRAQSQEADAQVTVAPLRQRIAAGAPPEYLYRADKSSWISVHELPALERDLLRRWLGE